MKLLPIFFIAFLGAVSLGVMIGADPMGQFVERQYMEDMK